MKRKFNKIWFHDRTRINSKKLGKSISIRMKLIIGFSIPIFLMIILAFTMYQTASKTIVKNYETATVGTIDKITDYYNLVFEGVQTKAIQYISNTSFIQYYGGKLKDDQLTEARQFNALKTDISTISASDKFIGNVYVFGEYGNDISNLRKFDHTYKKYIESPEGKEWGNIKQRSNWAGYHNVIDELYNVDPMSYGITITYKMQDNKGFIILDVKEQMIRQALEELSLGVNGRAAFITQDGREISINSEKENYFTELNFYNELVESDVKSCAEYKTIENKEYLFMMTKVESVNGIVCVMIPREQILAEMDSIKTITILFLVISTLISVGIGTFIALDISTVLTKISKAMKKIASGNLNVELKIKSNDELGLLVCSIRDMIASFRTLLQNAVNVSDDISESSTVLLEDANEILQASKQISFSINNIESGIQHQTEGTKECLVQMSELSNKINSVYHESGKIENVSLKTSQIAENGKNIIYDLNNKSDKIVQITNGILKEICELKEQTNIIYGIVDMISEIAEQTNLLSLNASIEAARAGDGGKGFAVVATEVRKLADQSVSSVGKIHGIIRQIQEKIENIVLTAEMATKNINYQTDSLKNTTHVFEEIKRSVETLAIGLKKSNEKIKEIDCIKTKTLVTVEGFSLIAEENEAASEEIKDIAKNQLVTAEKLNKTANVLTENEKKLNIAIGKFQI